MTTAPLPHIRDAKPKPSRTPVRTRLHTRRSPKELNRASDADAGSDGYQPPQSPEDDHPLVLGLKVAFAMLIADFVARSLGFSQPTWTVLTAAFLATSPPVASAKAAGRKLVALGVGIVLGLVGAYAAGWLSAVPSLHFALVGFVAGWLGTRSADYLFAAVVGTVVTFVGSGGGDPTIEVATQTVCMVLIGCAIGPAVVWAIERVRRWHWRRTHPDAGQEAA